MKLRMLPICFLLVLCLNCSAPRKSIHSETLFQDIAANYDLSKYNLILTAWDGRILLSNVKVTRDGKMIAEIKEAPNLNDTALRMDFYTRKKFINILEPATDSSVGNKYKAAFTAENIRKVRINKLQSGPDHIELVYEKHRILKLFIRVFVFTLAICLVASGIYSLIWVALNYQYFAFCYIATMVYGSYDAPEVIVLRKFRDEKLAPHFCGRFSIKVYYTLSPVFVRVFKNNKPVNRVIKSLLDQWVKKLKEDELRSINS